MAVVKAPLFSLSATDSLAKAIVFTRWKGRAVIRKWVKGSNPRSGLQVGQRAAVRWMSRYWVVLTAAQQTNWKNRAKKLALTGLNAFIQFNAGNVRRGGGIAIDPTLAAGAVEAAPTLPVATAGTKSVSLTWTDSAGANDKATYIYMSTVTGFTPSSATLIRIVNRGTGAFTVIGLVTGTAYFFLLKGCEQGGTLGTATAQLTATPT